MYEQHQVARQKNEISSISVTNLHSHFVNNVQNTHYIFDRQRYLYTCMQQSQITQVTSTMLWTHGRTMEKVLEP